MENNKASIRNLLQQERWTEENAHLMAEYLVQSDQSDLQEVARELFDLDQQDKDKSNERVDEELFRQVLKDIHQRINKPKKLPWLPYAAAVLVITFAATWFLMSNYGTSPTIRSASTIVVPGGNKATLTLADGRSISLSDEKSGIIIDSDVIKYNDGTGISTNDEKREVHSSTQTQLSLKTPNGGQYQITLPDGTKVWLNAASTLRYPDKFGSKERIVELEGEAYFDVSHVFDRSNKKIPFKVKAKDQLVEVLGTQFNITAYTDESTISTTLVKGRVRVASSAAPSIALLPGEQAYFENGLMSKRTVDVRNYVSWKDGIIILDQSDVNTVIRQVERWYDVKFDAIELSKSTKLNGILHRNAQLAGILEVLSINTGKKFEINGRRIMIK
ncbi:FecR family protein [Pedobacter nyackensis]|uniref:FecR family protein n=1 Tax=Pedobacter nyackensis TaxID=475255 RepID=UPI00292CB3A9|nr:FecR family protein [Pedobacter nyackensis]